MCRLRAYLSIILLLFSHSSSLVYAESSPECAHAHSQTAVGFSLASAGIWANALGRSHSVGAEVERLLREALHSTTKLKSPATDCFPGCKGKIAPLVIITSVPHKSITTRSAISECQKYDEASKKSPFQATDMKFTSFEDLNDWVSDFSRGSGEEGKRLYTYCPGSCSPSYSFSVTVSHHNAEDDTGLFYLRSVATCGLPRDTDDNQYKLQTYSSWSCADYSHVR